MGNNTGWIKLHRTIIDHPDWLAEPFTRSQAWIDLLLLANHKVGHIRKRGILIEIGRGQVGYSEETLAVRWKWSREKVRRYLGRLGIDGQISRNPVQQNPKLSILIEIVNYDLYQSSETTNETTEKHQTIQEQECKNEKKESLINNLLDGVVQMEPPAEKQKTKREAFIIPEWVPKEPWNAYVEMRGKMGAFTDYAKRLQIKELEQIMATSGGTPEAIIHQSIQLSWKGLFPLKKGGRDVEARGSYGGCAAHGNAKPKSTKYANWSKDPV